jgi:hypothetical protein
MPERANVAEDLYVVAVAIARQVVREAGVAWDEHRGEDIAQTLPLAGWDSSIG